MISVRPTISNQIYIYKLTLAPHAAAATQSDEDVANNHDQIS